MEEIDSSNIPSAPCLQMLIFPEETEMDVMLIQATSNEEEITCAQWDKCCQQFFILYYVDDVADNDW